MKIPNENLQLSKFGGQKINRPLSGLGRENGLTTTEHRRIFRHGISIVMINHSMYFSKLRTVY